MRTFTIGKGKWIKKIVNKEIKDNKEYQIDFEEIYPYHKMGKQELIEEFNAGVNELIKTRKIIDEISKRLE